MPIVHQHNPHYVFRIDESVHPVTPQATANVNVILPIVLSVSESADVQHATTAASQVITLGASTHNVTPTATAAIDVQTPVVITLAKDVLVTHDTAGASRVVAIGASTHTVTPTASVSTSIITPAITSSDFNPNGTDLSSSDTIDVSFSVDNEGDSWSYTITAEDTKSAASDTLRTGSETAATTSVSEAGIDDSEFSNVDFTNDEHQLEIEVTFDIDSSTKTTNSATYNLTGTS